MHRTTLSAHGLDRKLLTAQAFAALARDRLHAAPLAETASGGPSDFDLSPPHEPVQRPASYWPAAVLVPIVAHPEPCVLLTKRSPTLTKHAGQIAFPGGRIDATDACPLAAALRETEEEIGLTASAVDVLGYLDSYRTGTGYVITPVVGLIEPGFALALNAREVEESFEVPLNFLLNPANHTIDERTLHGRARQFYAIPHEGRYIWGATAGIIRNMYERLFSE